MTNDEKRHQLGIVWRDAGGPAWLRHRQGYECGCLTTNCLTPAREHFSDLEEVFGEWPSFHAIQMILGDREEWCYVEALGLVVVEPYRVSD